MTDDASTVVIGLGNEFRRDDGFGPAVVRALCGRIPATTAATTVSDAAELLDVWTGRRLAIVVDLVRTDLPTPGRVHRWTVGDAAGPMDCHGIDVAAALALAHVLGTAPGRVVLYAAEGSDVGFGTDLSPTVRGTVATTAAAIAAEVSESRAPAGIRHRRRRCAW